MCLMVLLRSLRAVVTQQAFPANINSTTQHIVDTSSYSASLQSTSPCVFGAILCADGSTACIDAVPFTGCVFDAVSPIRFDAIVPAFFDVLQDLTDDNVSFAVQYSDDAVTTAATALVDCGRSLGTAMTRCGALATFEKCLNTTSMTLASKVSTLVGTDRDRIQRGLDKVPTVLKRVTDQCMIGCDHGTCTGAPLAFQAPRGCTCKALTVDSDDAKQARVTTDRCAVNAALYRLNENGDKEVVGKIPLPYMGCYVGMDDKPWDWSTCAPTYASIQLAKTQFVRCVDQFGHTRSLSHSPPTVVLHSLAIVLAVVILVV